MSLSLTGCKSSDYNEALKLEEDKDYSSATMTYEELGEYKDSRKRLESCNAMIDAIEKYNGAQNEIEEKNNELETVISETKAVKKAVLAMPEIEIKIYALIDELNVVEYKDVLSNLSDKQISYEKSVKQYALEDASMESRIIECLYKSFPFYRTIGNCL